MKTVIINRVNTNDKQTIGRCYVRNEQGKIEFEAASLERGWLQNKPNVSSVPAGVYMLVKEYSPRFDTDLWELKEVYNRSETKFHVSNYWYQLEGCIALGQDFTDINDDGYLDVTHSGNTMDAFHNVMKGHKALLIIHELYIKDY